MSAPARVRVLGIAQDGGHPQAGCMEPCCAPAWLDPGQGHRVACLGLICGEQRWLIDCTPDLPDQLRLVGGPPLSGILLTHAHMGHYTGLIHLGREAMGAEGVPVYAMPRMARLLERQQPWALLSKLGHVVVEPVRDQRPVSLSAQITATPFLVPHRDELSETVGWILQGPRRSVAWLPDIDKWSRWEVPLESLLARVDLAFLDGTFYADGEIARDMSQIPHPFMVETLQRLAEAPPEIRAKVRFVHLNHTNPALDPQSEASAAVTAAGMAVAREGDRHPL